MDISPGGEMEQRGVCDDVPYVKKMIYSGRFLEIEKYPVNKNGNRIRRSGKYKMSSEAQQNLNEKNAKKCFSRLVECNFTDKDVFVTLKYGGDKPDSAQLKKDFQNFLRRLKYKCKKCGYPEPKYVGVSHDGSERPHHHLILTGYSWDFIKALWDKGSVHISNLVSDEEYGYIQVSKYIMNEKNNNTFSKRWCASQNLAKPVIKTQPIKRLNIYSRVEAPKGYKIIDVEITDNVFTGTYQYVRCVRIN